MPKKKAQTTQELVFTGNPREDFSSFLKSREKPYQFGLKLIEKYTRNQALLTHLRLLAETPRAKKKMIRNVIIISMKYFKKKI